MITLLFHLFRLFPFLWLGYEPSTCPHVTQRSPTETRSEEHTSELQSRLHLVCRLLLEKKKNESRQNLACRLLLEKIEGDLERKYPRAAARHFPARLEQHSHADSGYLGPTAQTAARTRA